MKHDVVAVLLLLILFQGCKRKAPDDAVKGASHRRPPPSRRPGTASPPYSRHVTRDQSAAAPAPPDRGSLTWPRPAVEGAPRAPRPTPSH